MKQFEDKTINTNLMELFMNIGRVIRHRIGYESPISQLTLLQLETLIFLKKHEKAQMLEVAEYFHITKPTATVMLNKLVDLRFVRRVSDPKDRRIVRLEVTELGYKQLTAGEKYKNQKVEQLLSVLSVEDRKELLRIMKVIFEKAQKNYEKKSL